MELKFVLSDNQLNTQVESIEEGSEEIHYNITPGTIYNLYYQDSEGDHKVIGRMVLDKFVFTE